MKIMDLLREPDLVVISGAITFLAILLSVAAVIASFVDQSRILLST